MPAYTFTSPEGKEYEVNGPEGSTRDQAFEVLQARLAGTPTASTTGERPATKPPSSAMQQLSAIQPEGERHGVDEPIAPYAWNKFRQGLQIIPRVAVGASDVLTHPFRRLVEDINRAPPSPNMPALDAYNRMVNIPEMNIPKDVTGRPKFLADAAGHLAEFAGAGGPISAGVISRAAKPLATAGHEIANLIASAEGSLGGKHIAPEGYGNLGELAGAFTGPGLVNIGRKVVVGPATNVVNYIRDKLGIGVTEAERNANAAERAAKILVPSMNTEVAARNIQAAKDIAAKVPGMGENLTLGQATDTPSIIARQKQLANTPETLDRAQQMARGMEESIAAHTERRFPSPPEGVTPLTGAQRAAELKIAEHDAALARLEEQEAKLGERFPRGDAEAAGGQSLDVRNRLAATKQAAKARYESVYADTDALGVKVGMNDVTNVASKINKDSGNAFQDKPGVIGEILSRYSPKPEAAKVVTPPGGRGTITVGRNTPPQETVKEVPFKEFHSLYQKAGQEFASLSAEAKMGGPGATEAAQKARMVGQIRDKLKSKLDEFEASPHGDVVTKFKEANEFYKTKYADIFKRGVGGEIVAPGRFGRMASNEDANIFKRLILKPNDPSGVHEYLNMVKGDKEGLQALENGVMDIFSREVVKDGRINPTAMRNFLTTNKQSLEAMPWIAKQINTAENAMKSIHANRENVLNAQKEFSKSTLARLHKSENPEAMIKQSMTNPALMENIIKNAATPAEKQAVARAMLDNVRNQPDPVAFMNSNRKSLEKALGKQHVGFLETILTARKIQGRVEPPQHLTFGKMGDPLAEATGTSIPSITTDIKNVKSGYSSMPYVAARAGVRWWSQLNNADRDRVLTEAIYNPPVAEALGKHLRQPTAKTQKVMEMWLLPQAARGAAAAYDYGQKESEGIHVRANRIRE